jgi:putative endonuclease
VTRKRPGQRGEDLACDFLVKKGYQIVERNYTYGKGELDIIVKDGEILVFVEVKSRYNLEFGPPELGITKKKQGMVRYCAEAYLHERDIVDTDCRIDVVAILFRGKEPPQINHILNAF